MLSLPKSVGLALRIIVALACCSGIWSSLVLARADYLFRQDTEQSLRAAIRLAPDGWQYYMRLAQFDRIHAHDLLATSLRLNRFDAQADIELGLQYEADGDFDRAEKQLLDAFEVDHTYVPRWSLANYYFRRDNLSAFWTWARRAAEMPADNIGALFELCWRVSPDPQNITGAIMNDDPKMLRQYIAFLSGMDQPKAMATVAPHLVRSGDPVSDRPLMLSVVDRLVGVHDVGSSTAMWRMLIAQHWINADQTVPNNANFQRPPLPVSFDWSLPEYEGLHSWPGSSGLQTEFTGSEPEACVIAEQVVALAPGDYSMSYSYRTSGIPPGTGVRWQILDAKSNAVLAESPNLSSEELKYSGMGFTVPHGASLLRMRLLYQRTLGTTRISGTLDVLSTQIQAIPKS
jgi:hypothetical protein